MSETLFDKPIVPGGIKPFDDGRPALAICRECEKEMFWVYNPLSGKWGPLDRKAPVYVAITETPPELYPQRKGINFPALTAGDFLERLSHVVNLHPSRTGEPQCRI